MPIQTFGMTKTLPPLSLDQLREIQARQLDNADTRILLWEIKRLQGQLLQVYNELGVRSEFDALFARDMARLVRAQLGREPAIADDASRRHQAKREE